MSEEEVIEPVEQEEAPREETTEEKLYRLRRYLAQTDWHEILYEESGIEMPEGIATARQLAREQIEEILVSNIEPETIEPEEENGQQSYSE